MRRFFFTAVTGLSLLAAVPAFAQTADRDVTINLQNNTEVMGDFIVGPTRHVLSMGTGSTRVVEVQLTNRSGEEATFDIHTEDFSSDPDNEGAPQFYQEGSDGPFPARLWLTPQTDRVRLLHGERAFIRVSVAVPRDAEPGDHQAALIVSRHMEAGQRGIAVESRVASLFIITVDGPVERKGSIDGLSVRHFLNWSYPVAFRARLQNNGTVHAAPLGSLEIRNIFGVVVDTITIKDWIILRESTRTFDLSWSPRFALGYYSATMDLSIDGWAVEPLSVTFWVIPLLPVLLVLLTIFLVSFLVQYISARFEIKRKNGDVSEE